MAGGPGSVRDQRAGADQERGAYRPRPARPVKAPGCGPSGLRRRPGNHVLPTFKLLTEPQHDRVVDALLLRIAAVRRVCAGHLATAAALAAQAEQILRVHPPRDYLEDAESAFHTWVAVAMQEQFAVAHELLHYLEVADPAAFTRQRAQVSERLQAASKTLTAGSVLGTAHNVGLHRPTGYRRHCAGVEPYNWWYAPRFDNPPPLTSEPVHEVLSALAERVERERGLLTELTCDVVAATACAMFAQRGNGWTPLQAAASSALALSTLGLVVDMDRRSPLGAPGSGDEQFGEWELRLGGLRVLLADAVRADVLDSDGAPTPAEVADAMRRATGLYDAVLRTRYTRLDTWPTTAAPPTGSSGNELLLSAGFLNLRARSTRNAPARARVVAALAPSQAADGAISSDREPPRRDCCIERSWVILTRDSSGPEPPFGPSLR